MAASRLRKRIHTGLLVFWTGVTAWMLWNMQAQDVDDALFESDAVVEVTRSGDRIRFRPRSDTASAALVFYPGALADPDAYAPVLRAVAERGFEVVLLELPYRLAVRDAQWQRVEARTLEEIMSEERNRAWVVGGHSRGGALAARFAGQHAGDLRGLLLIGTSHPREDDLSYLAIDVTKVYATNDGLASEPEVLEFARNLPATTQMVRIDGGNHRGFASYGWQFGDHSATITRAEQQSQTVEAIVAQLQRVQRNEDDARRSRSRSEAKGSTDLSTSASPVR